MTLYSKVCRQCEKTFEGQKKSTFCSRSCRNSFYARSEMLISREMVCKVCSKVFLAYRSNRKYCSEHCKNKATWERRGKKHRPFPNQRLWGEKRIEVLSLQKKRCWLCKGKIDGRFQLHHLDFGDHSVRSERLAALHFQCHNLMHGVTVSISKRGRLSFYGRGLDYLRRNHMKKIGGK